jgi:hypothetical protein
VETAEEQTGATCAGDCFCGGVLVLRRDGELMLVSGRRKGAAAPDFCLGSEGGVVRSPS